MSNTAAGTTRTISRRFILLWILSLVIPGLILMALRGLLVADPTWDLGYRLAILVPLPVWFLIGFLQYWLLQPYRRRSLWWLIATFCGGILGMFVGGPAMIWMMPQSEVIVLSSLATPEWMFTPYPLPPAAFAGAVAAGLLGLAQAPSSRPGPPPRPALDHLLCAQRRRCRVCRWARPLGLCPCDERDIPRRNRGQHIDAHRDRPLDRHGGWARRLWPADGARHAMAARPQWQKGVIPRPLD